MNYFGYEVDPSFLSDGGIAWKSTGANGEMIIGTKGGRKYFIKRNVNVRKAAPDASLAMRASYEEKCTFIETKQKELMRLMSGLSFDGDHVAIEEENFWDTADGAFVTVTRFLEGALDDHYDFSKESVDIKRSIFLSMVQLVGLLHDHRVIHSDLKEGNFLFKRSGSGFDLYIIDFDSSYPQDNVPGHARVPYTPGYESPEIAIYTRIEDDDECSHSEIITPKTDIYTLGIIFHKIWTQKLPSFDTEDISLGIAIASVPDVHVMLDKSLDTMIGKESGATYISLVNWMLARDPDDRPSYKQISDVLNDKLSVPAKFVVGSDVPPFTGLWNEHSNFALYNMDELKAQGVSSFQKVNDSGLKYRIVKDGVESTLTIHQLLENGILKSKPVEVEEPWPEDKIVMADNATLEANKISAIRRSTNFHGDKIYEIVDVFGVRMYKTAKSLVGNGLATYVVEAPSDEFGEPWPEDNAVYAPKSFLDSKNISNIRTIESGGIHCYEISYSDGKETRILPSNVVFLLGYIVKKK